MLPANSEKRILRMLAKSQQSVGTLYNLFPRDTAQVAVDLLLASMESRGLIERRGSALGTVGPAWYRIRRDDERAVSMVTLTYPGPAS